MSQKLATSLAMPTTTKEFWELRYNSSDEVRTRLLDPYWCIELADRLSRESTEWCAKRHGATQDQSGRLLKLAKELCTGNIDIVFDRSESPIETMFFASMVLCSSAMEPFSLVMTKSRKETRGFDDVASWHIALQWSLRLGSEIVRPDGLLWRAGDPNYAPIVIECDSVEFHSNREKMISDRSRDRRFMREGYRVVRHMGPEIYSDPIDTAHSFILDLLGMDNSPESLIKDV